jgi:hypothetical protein
MHLFWHGGVQWINELKKAIEKVEDEIWKKHPHHFQPHVRIPYKPMKFILEDR